MNTNKHQKVARRKQRIAHRLRPIRWTAQAWPMLTASNIHDDVSTRTRGLAAGGIGAMPLLELQTGLIGAIDGHVQVFKRHLPYRESDHVMGIAYNLLSGGTRLQHIEQRRAAGRSMLSSDGGRPSLRVLSLGHSRQPRADARDTRDSPERQVIADGSVHRAPRRRGGP